MWQETRAKYTDAEVDAIVAVHRAIADAHHSKYTDAEAVNAVETAGKVGINNPSPANVLDVVGLGVTKDTPVIPDNEDTISIYGDGRAYFKGRDVTNDIEFIMGTSNIGGAFVGAMSNHDLWLRTNNVTRLTILKATGYVGINTTDPAELFDIKTNAGFNRAVVLGPKNAILNNGSYIEFTSSSTPGYGARIGGIRSGAGAANALVFLTGKNTQTERIRIDDDGKVGFSTNSPTAVCDVNSDIIRLRTAKTPATAGAAGNQGDFCWDADYFYICVATNTWERTPHAWDINVYDDAAETKLAGIETGANVGSKFMWAWVNWDDGNSSHQTLGSLPANAFVVRTFLHITTQFDDTVCVVVVGTTGDPDAYIQNYTLSAIAAGVKDDVVWGVNRGYRSGADGTVQTTLLTMGGDGTQGAVLVGIEYMVVGANS